MPFPNPAATVPFFNNFNDHTETSRTLNCSFVFISNKIILFPAAKRTLLLSNKTIELICFFPLNKSSYYIKTDKGKLAKYLGSKF